jgi:hypothetical protein
MKTSASRYLIVLVFIASAVVFAVAGFNYFADPYGIWHFGIAGDWIKARPRLQDFERLHKAHEVEHMDADAILLGNSRVVIGLDPHHPALPKNTYNLALSGCTVYEMLRYLQHACSFRQPKLVIVGTDREMFDAVTPHEASFSEDRLAVDPQNKPKSGWQISDAPATLFSASSLVDSVRTILYKGGPISYPDGCRDLELEKPFALAKNVLIESDRWKRRASLYAPTLADGTNPQFDAFREFLQFCKSHHIQLVIYVNPVHSVLLDVLRAHEQDYDDWFQRMVTMVDDEYPDAQVWDFAAYNQITSEPLPSRTMVDSGMKYYWEISHYRQNVGNMVLDRIFDRPGALQDFGWKINRENIASDLSRLKHEALANRG